MALRFSLRSLNTLQISPLVVPSKPILFRLWGVVSHPNELLRIPLEKWKWQGLEDRFCYFSFFICLMELMQSEMLCFGNFPTFAFCNDCTQSDSEYLNLIGLVWFIWISPFIFLWWLIHVSSVTQRISPLTKKLIHHWLWLFLCSQIQACAKGNHLLLAE